MAYRTAVPDVFHRRHQLLSLCFWCTLLISALFVMNAVDVAGQCYTSPCSSAIVPWGLSCVTFAAAFLFILQPCYGLYMMRVRCTDLVAGVYIGCSSMATLVALNTAMFWGSEGDLAQAVAMGAGLSVNESALTSFGVMSWLASALFVMQLVSTTTCCRFRDVLLEAGVGSSYDYSQLPTGLGAIRAGDAKFHSYQSVAPPMASDAGGTDEGDHTPVHFL